MSTDEPPNTDGTDPDAPTPEDERAEATVNRDAEGETLGCLFYIGSEGLETLGVDSAERLVYWAEPDGTVRVEVRGENDV